MTNTSTAQLRSWIGRSLVDPTGDRIGRIEDIYLDVDTGQPEWLALSTGWFGKRISFVPLVGARPQGQDVISQWGKDHVRDAPHAEPDGQLSRQEEARLYRHYGLQYGDEHSQTGLPEGHRAGFTQGRSADDAMTRSEEELRVSKQQGESGRVRLRKWVETEHVGRTVPVSHEEARIRREPITDDDADQATTAELAESERELVLTEEQLVANKEVVPKERVRLEKEVVTEDVPVEADLRKERVEVEGGADRPRRRSD